jgi:hypothetical protein
VGGVLRGLKLRFQPGPTPPELPPPAGVTGAAPAPPPAPLVGATGETGVGVTGVGSTGATGVVVTGVTGAGVVVTGATGVTGTADVPVSVPEVDDGATGSAPHSLNP